MKSLPMLYSRTNGGAIQTLVMQIDGAKYRAVTGQLDGKKTESGWKIAKAKNTGKANATTAEEQALAEAQAKWDKKAKRGYTPDIKKVDSCMSYIEAMLAAPGDDIIDADDFTYPKFVQNKFNGVRAITNQPEGEENVSKSRGGEIWDSVPHINLDLESFFADHPEAVIDGEFYNYELREKLNELISIVRKQNPCSADLKKSEEMVKYYVYDGYGFAGMDQNTPYEKRKAWLDKNLPKYAKKYIVMVKTHVVNSRDELEALYDSFIADGEEGAIIRFPEMVYENGKRSKKLLKYKPEHDDECTVKKLIEGTGNWAGCAKTAVIEWKGKVFEATFLGTMEQARQRLKEKAKWEGLKNVTFLYIGLTGKGVPNYARIDPDNCFKGDR